VTLLASVTSEPCGTGSITTVLLADIIKTYGNCALTLLKMDMTKNVIADNNVRVKKKEFSFFIITGWLF
jgi:predicted nucleotide-binding protein (sugar kinase/HSP70/actin superfamily)